MAKKKQKVREKKYLPSPINNKMLNYAVYVMSPAEKLLYAFLIFVVGGLAGLIFYGGLFKEDGAATTATYISSAVIFALVGGIAIKVFLPMMKDMLKQKRNKVLQQQFMNLLETLSTSLAAGNSLRDAFFNAKDDLLGQYDEKAMIIVEVSEIVAGVKNGNTIEEMLTDFGARSGNEDIVNFANVISNCYRLGGNFSSVVRRTREIIGDKVAVADEIETKIASNKMQLNVMCTMPVVLVGMLKISSAQFAESLASVLGILVTTVAIGIFVGAYFWGRKIIDIG